MGHPDLLGQSAPQDLVLDPEVLDLPDEVGPVGMSGQEQQRIDESAHAGTVVSMAVISSRSQFLHRVDGLKKPPPPPRSRMTVLWILFCGPFSVRFTTSSTALRTCDQHRVFYQRKRPSYREPIRTDTEKNSGDSSHTCDQTLPVGVQPPLHRHDLLGQTAPQDLVLDLEVLHLPDEVGPVGVGRQEQQRIDESAHAGTVMPMAVI